MIPRLVAAVAAWSQSFSIRFKIMGLAVGMVVLMGSGAALLAQAAFLQHAQAELDQRGASIARDVAARGTDHVLTHNTLALHDLLADTMANNQDLRYVAVFDAGGRLAAHTFPGGFPTDLLRLPAPNPGSRLAVELLSTEEGLVHDIAVPVLDGAGGLVRVGMSEQRLRRAAMVMTQQLVVAILIMAALGVSFAFALTKFLIRPVLSLVEASRAIGAGDLTRQAGPGPPDEIGRLIEAFNAMVRQLAAARRIREELLDQVITAQEEERRRLARELHDETSQAISSLLVGLRNLEAVPPDPDTLRQRTAELRQVAAQTLAEIHHLVMELRPRSLDELGLPAALSRYVSDFSAKHGIAVDLQVLGGRERLPARVETCLYRIVQEALTNVARHARATAASVVLDVRPDQATAVIEDNGVGFDPAMVLQPGNERGALGLHGMQERAALAGGTLQVEASPGRGTAVYIRIPIRREEPGREPQESAPAAGR